MRPITFASIPASKECIIVDVDGTLVDVSELRPWVTGERKDYDMFHTLSASAPPIQWVIDEVNDQWDGGMTVMLVTARNDKFYRLTVDWLDQHRVAFDELHMRRDGDYRSDYEVKKEILEGLMLRGFDPVLAFDDNPHVIKLWEEFGIPVSVVPGWED